MRTLLLLLSACAGPTGSLPVDRPMPPALPGPELLRVSHAAADANARFSALDPLVYELSFPPGVRVEGQGLPDDVPGVGDLHPMYTDPAERSILQIELPVARQGTTDEEQMDASVAQFDPPRFCRVGDPACLWGDDEDGRWRAWRVRDDGAGEVVTELQLAHTWSDPMEAAPTPSWRIIGLWMPASDPPLDELDRVRFEYVGHVPRKATDWTRDDPAPRPFRPRLRYRPAPEVPGSSCPGTDSACWTLLDASDVQPLEILAGPPAWLTVTAPFDAALGTPVTGRVVFLDRWMNPTRVTGDVQLVASGRPLGPPLHLADAWAAEATFPAQRVGMFRLSATTAAPVQVRGQYLRIWRAGELTRRRKVGDVHVHTGGDGELAFSRSAMHGDHRGNFVRNVDALRYLDQVANLDFGAISEHAILFDGWAPPTPLPLFGPGGLCEVDAAVEPDAGDWWTPSQEAALAYQQAHPGFTTFPAYEWHGAMFGATLDAALHRIVLYRDHDTAGPFGLPMLPGNVRDRPPACLFRWLDDLGFDNQDVLVMPHMMFARPRNFDWALTYTPIAPWDGVADGTRAQHYQTVGEIFSSRNASEGTPGASTLTAFEGAATPGTTDPYSWRTGWRDTEAVIGVIGASDNHVGMPGSNDFAPDHPDASTHEPGGYAFVLADDDSRDGIYDALRARHTYATSGLRAWVDWQLTDGRRRWTMGDELDAGNACALSTSLEIAAGRPVRSVAVWSTETGSALPWTPVFTRQAVNQEVVQVTTTLRNPVPAGGGTHRYLYYVRAFTGPTLAPRTSPEVAAAGHEDAIWTSPVWVTWTGAACP